MLFRHPHDKFSRRVLVLVFPSNYPTTLTIYYTHTYVYYTGPKGFKPHDKVSVNNVHLTARGYRYNRCSLLARGAFVGFFRNLLGLIESPKCCTVHCLYGRRTVFHARLDVSFFQCRPVNDVDPSKDYISIYS